MSALFRPLEPHGARVFNRLLVSACVLLLSSPVMAASFDHAHGRWNALLAGHVHWVNGGTSSIVDYDGLARDRVQLDRYLSDLSAVSMAQFEPWSKLQRQAFLINAYNAFTVALILSKYPHLNSIKELGGLFSSPWKKQFITLLDDKRSLDDIEQGLLRGAADFDEPRVHFAVNCASIGCPPLRPEAYVADRLAEQLDDQARRFLGDASRNHLDKLSGTLTLSMIFKWYAQDFSKGFPGVRSVQEFVARYPEALRADSEDIARLRRDGFVVRYSDYDWSLNRAQ